MLAVGAAVMCVHHASVASGKIPLARRVARGLEPLAKLCGTLETRTKGSWVAERHPRHHFCFMAGFLPGVPGRDDCMPPMAYLPFFSPGFKIWNEHMSVSSTDIMAPALSNSPQ